MLAENLIFKGFNDETFCREYECPLCGGTMSVQDNVFYGRCEGCLATIIDYKPAPHQREFHQSMAKYRLNIGGFGSGKTTMDCFEIALHALSTPNGKTCITAQTLQQVKEAALPELDKFLPPWCLAKKPVITPLPKYTLKNGHEILVYASDDEEKFRSLNLTAFLIIEASGVPFKVFQQLQTRLRNKAAVVKDKEGNEIAHNFMGIIETNPENCWCVDEFLLRSGVIRASKNVNLEAYRKMKSKKPEPAYHSFLSASVDNSYLPTTYIQDTCAGKNDRWINKYIYCSLELNDGVVYPEFIDCIVDPFPIPDNWIRIYGFDKGWTDETCLVCGAIDPTNFVCYIYDEYYESQKPITYHGRRIKEKTANFPMYKPIQADPSVRAKNDRDGVSYKDYFYNVSGVVLQEANNSILDGIERLRDFMYTGKMKVFSSCVNMKDEARQYTWKADKNGDQREIPVDKHNHLMDAWRYLAMGLPNDFRDCYITKKEVLSAKDSIITRITPNSDEDYLSIDGGVIFNNLYMLD